MKRISLFLHSELGCLLLDSLLLVSGWICVCVCPLVRNESRDTTVMNEHQNGSVTLSHSMMPSRQWSCLLLSQSAKKTPTLRTHTNTLTYVYMKTNTKCSAFVRTLKSKRLKTFSMLFFFDLFELKTLSFCFLILFKDAACVSSIFQRKQCMLV